MDNVRVKITKPTTKNVTARSGSLFTLLMLTFGLLFSGVAILPTVASTSNPILPITSIKPFLPGNPQLTSGPIQCAPHGYPTNESGCWPMGVADYGINPQTGQTYSYKTQVFEASITINSINIGENNCGYLCGGGEDVLTLQQNTVANISVGGVQQTYWTQDVPFLSYYPASQTYSVVPLDNIWNFTGVDNVPGNMTYVTGNLNNQCVAFGGAPELYYCEVPAISNLKLPLTIQTQIDVYDQCMSKACTNYVTFYMEISHGKTVVYSSTFDKIEFTNGDAKSKPWFLVEPCLPLAPASPANFGKCSKGNKVSPIGLPYDAEWIIGGPAGGSQVIVNEISAQMSEQYLNPSNGEFQSIPHAYSNGWDTAEGAGNVHMASSGPPTANAQTGKDNVEAGLW